MGEILNSVFKLTGASTNFVLNIAGTVLNGTADILNAAGEVVYDAIDSIENLCNEIDKNFDSTTEESVNESLCNAIDVEELTKFVNDVNDIDS